MKTKTLHKLGLRERLRQAIKEKNEADAFCSRLMIYLDAVAWKHELKHEDFPGWVEQYVKEMNAKGAFVPPMPLFVAKKEDQPPIPSPAIEANVTAPATNNEQPPIPAEPTVAPPVESSSKTG